MPGLFTLATSETWKPSVFRPPVRFVKTAPPSSTVPSYLPCPSYPGVSASSHSTPKEPRLVPPPALGQSPSLSPRDGDSTLPLVSSSSFSPLKTPIRTYFHKFTQSASEKRVYPLEMFLSVRHDVAHTPYGVLRWAVRQYLQIPTLKVPSHLQLSLHEAAEPEDGVTRGALGCSLRSGCRARPKPVRLTRHKVMSILSRITPAKYDVLLNEMVMLPLRQETDAELMEICKTMFDKAVQEPAYSGLYARLAHDICVLKDGERELEPRGQTFSRRFCRLLITLCEAEFQRPLQLSADDMVDRTTGKPLDKEEVEVKRSRLKDRLVGNIRFVAELFKAGLVAERVIDEIIQILVNDYNPDEPTAKEEYVFEVFQTLVRYTGEAMKEQLPQLLAQSLGIAKTIELSHPKPRVVFLMMNLADLNQQNGWVAPHLLQRYVRHPKNGKNSIAAATTRKALSGVTPISRSALLSPMIEKNMKKSAHPNRAVQSPQVFEGEMHANGKKHFLSSDYASGNGGSKNIGNANLSILTNGSNDDNINRNVSDVSRSSVFPAEQGWRGQHQPYGNIVLTHVIGCGNDSYLSTCNNTSSTIESFQPNSPLTPFHVDSDCVLPCSKVKGRNKSDMGDMCVTSEGQASACPSGIRSPMTDTTVNMKEVTEQLMSFFRNGEEATAIAMLREMELKSIVVCLTWWLRLATTNTAFFDDRGKVASLLSSLLIDCGGAYDVKVLFSTVLEWIRFDVEKGEYDNCPRMFGNMAQMILQCHLPCNDKLPHVEVVRDLMQCGLFNVLLRELTISGGTDQMVTAVKSCYPVSLQILNNLRDPEDERHILRIAAQNRFRLLPYLLSVSSVTSNAMPGTPSMRPPGSLSPLSLRSSSLGDPFTSTGHYDPLSQCLMLQRVMDDTEFVLFRKLRDAAGDGGQLSTATTRWREEALQLALSPLGNNSTVCELIAVMRVVGALLACSSVSGNKGRMLVSNDDVDYVVGEILSRRPGILYQGAVAMELIMYHTQTLNDTLESSRADMLRLGELKRVFNRWCENNIIHRFAVLELLDVLDNTGDKLSVYAAYHENVADVSWHCVLRQLRTH